jgi:hypothetical protein
VALFEGLDTEIGERLEAMREGRERESARLRPETDVEQMWTKRGPRAQIVGPLRPQFAS